jgi:crotonobetainyl-CoA:carnitine CoA-transferase CaiB-like acyl-CoA transferase
MFITLTRDEAATKLRKANTAYGFVNDLSALGHHPALRRTPVQLPNGNTAHIVAPAVIKPGEPLDLGPVPAIGANSGAIRHEFG